MNKKISQLVEATSIADADIFVVVQGGETKKVSKANLLATVNSLIAAKADMSAVTSALALKADASAVSTALATKLTASNNLSDLASPATARTNLGLGTMATQNAALYLPLTGGALTGLTTITIPNNANTTGLVINQNDTVSNNKHGLEVNNLVVANDVYAVLGKLNGIITSAFQAAVSGQIVNSSSTNGVAVLANHNGSGGHGFRIWYAGNGSVTAFSSLHDNTSSLGASFTATHYGNAFNAGGMVALDHRGNGKEFYSIQNVTNANLTSGGFYLVSKSTINNGTTYSKTNKFFEIRGEVSISSGVVNDSQILFDVNQTNGNATGNAAQITQSGSGYGLYIASANVGARPLVVRASSGQTANLTEWQNSAGTILLSINNVGLIDASVNGIRLGNAGVSLKFADSNGEIRCDTNPSWLSKNNTVTFKTYDENDADGAWVFRGSFSNTNKVTILANKGLVGIGVTPTSLLHIKAGTNSLAPIKLTAGTNLTTPENGAIEFDGTNLYITIGGVRKTIQIA